MSNTRDVVLLTKSLTVDLGGDFLLENVSIAIKRGEVIGLIGPNGSGKTTLINTIAGLVKPMSGSIEVNGRLLDRIKLSERAKLVSVVPQNIPYTFGFNCFDIVLMGRYPYMKKFDIETTLDRNIVDEAMGSMKISHLANEKVDNLSAGERQRVFIARGLAQQPDFLLLDEPTANLDIQFQIEVMMLIRTLAKNGLTIMAAIHNLSLAAKFCDRLILLHKGRLVLSGPPDKVLTMLNIQKVFNVNSFVADDLLTGELELHGMDLMRPAQPIKRILRVHVVGGGGETNKIFYILKSAGFEVTAGILTDGTNDHWSACILGLDFVSVPDPTALDEKMLVKNKDLISSADYIVVCNGIFAEINLINLREIETCRNVLLVEESGVLPSDYTSGKAITIYQELRKVGRITSLQRLTSELQADRVEP